uniref:Uncharacterized protein n=1 Tax=Candidatus Kentrum sp. FW TaxID=2126338 RepID=A0A450RTC1_9GAMM|nr:MAG: hypothetical protein BECKFW1821A_GA0114235_100134 [Candidatus Kentron sp. FW]
MFLGDRPTRQYDIWFCNGTGRPGAVVGIDLLITTLSSDLCKGFLLAGAVSYATGTADVLALAAQLWLAVLAFLVAYFLIEDE